MTQWRTFTFFCRYKHNVEDRPELVDKACLATHDHGMVEPVKIDIIVHTKEWVDFKDDKEMCTNVIEKFSFDKQEHEGLPYYDFGTIDTEHLSKDMYKLILATYSTKYTNVQVQLRIQETPKYGIFIDEGGP